MADKFRDKYRIASARLQGWDYGSNASYFVTICTRKMTAHFGQIINGKMHLNDVGLIAEQFWREIPEHFPFILLDVFVVMPNHIHGILIIDKMEQSISIKDAIETPKLGVSTNHPGQPTKSSGSSKGGKNPKWKSGTLGVILNQYKRICSIKLRKLHPDFDWHERYYDHIIRDEKDYLRIKNYILNNPENWENDKFFNE